MKTNQHFINEMVPKFRFSSPAIREWTRRCYLHLLNSSDPDHMSQRDQYMNLIIALRLADLPKQEDETVKNENFIL